MGYAFTEADNYGVLNFREDKPVLHRELNEWQKRKECDFAGFLLGYKGAVRSYLFIGTDAITESTPDNFLFTNLRILLTGSEVVGRGISVVVSPEVPFLSDSGTFVVKGWYRDVDETFDADLGNEYASSYPPPYDTDEGVAGRRQYTITAAVNGAPPDPEDDGGPAWVGFPLAQGIGTFDAVGLTLTIFDEYALDPRIDVDVYKMPMYLIANQSSPVEIQALAQAVYEPLTDFTTVLEAAISAVGGGEIVIAEGTYTFLTTATIEKSNITIRGMGKGATILQADTGLEKILEIVASDAVPTVANITITGLSIVNANGTPAQGMTIGKSGFVGDKSVSGIVIDDVEFVCAFQSVSITGDMANPDWIRDIRISNCRFVGDAASTGINGSNMEDIRICNNIFYSPTEVTGDAITLATVNRLSISSNILRTCGGIAVTAVTDYVIESNLLEGTTIDPVAISAGNAVGVVSDNTLINGSLILASSNNTSVIGNALLGDDSIAFGISLDGFDNSVVQGNLVTNFETLLSVDSCSNVQISGNTLKTSQKHGIQIIGGGSYPVSVVGNTINDYGKAEDHGGGFDYAGIYVEGGVDFFINANNLTLSNSIAPMGYYGIWVDADSKGSVTNNNLFEAGTEYDLFVEQDDLGGANRVFVGGSNGTTGDDTNRYTDSVVLDTSASTYAKGGIV